jgi:hypothetical protein
MSIMPVPVPQSTRAEILTNIQTAGPGLFKQAQNEVLDYIESCQLSSFLATAEWEELRSTIEVAEKNAKKDGGSHTGRQRNFVTSSKASIYAEYKSLRNILTNQIATRYFKDFCQRIFVNESLFFWLDVENYVQLPGTDYMPRAAMKIARKYIYDNAQQQINISHATRAEILKCIINPSRTLFKRAQLEIFKLLEQDALPKFLRSAEFAAMQETLQAAVSLGQEKQQGRLSILQRAMGSFVGVSSND